VVIPEQKKKDVFFQSYEFIILTYCVAINKGIDMPCHCAPIYIYIYIYILKKKPHTHTTTTTTTTTTAAAAAAAAAHMLVDIYI